MYKRLSCTKSIYREARAASPVGVDFNSEFLFTEEQVRKDLKDYFNSEFSLHDEYLIQQDIEYTRIDCFENLDFSKVIHDLETFIDCINLFQENNKLDLLNVSEPLKQLEKQCKLSKNYSISNKSLCSSANRRWTNFINLIVTDSRFNGERFNLILDLVKHLKSNFSKDSKNIYYSSSLDLYHELLEKGLLKKSDFITSQTLAIYNDKHTPIKVSLSGENQFLRFLIKKAFPNLLTRPSEKFVDQLHLILRNFLDELEDFENLSLERLNKINLFLTNSYELLIPEIKKDIFKENFKTKFVELKLHELNCHPKKEISDMINKDIEDYFTFDTTTEISKETMKINIIKVFQALFASKMWCAEKAIIHDLFKENKYIDLGNVEAFVLGKFIEDVKLKKSSIKVCPHCRLTELIWKHTAINAPKSPTRIRYSVSPKTTPNREKFSHQIDLGSVCRIIVF